MEGFYIRCSSLGKIMAKSSGLTEKEEKRLEELQAKNSKSKELQKLLDKRNFKPKFDLSQGAKTHIEEEVEKIFYNYNGEVNTRALQKGIETEEDCIKLYNDFFFETCEKNTVRIYEDGITGECDVDYKINDEILDFKSSETIRTFPKLPEQGINSLYEWQGRGYMKLYDRSRFKLVYCCVDTPDHLIKPWEDLSLHYVSDIDPRLRITIALDIERDFELENLIDYKVKEAHKYADWYHLQLLKKNR